MNRFICTLSFVLLAFAGYAQKKSPFPLHSGDLIFQDLDCGDMCNAIEEVTQGFDGNRFSHVGLIDIKGDSIQVIEAMGPGVRKVLLSDFLKRSQHKVFIGRVKTEYAPLIDEAMGFALSALGKPYDDEFIYGNGKYYCSELIYDAFKYANKDRPFFELEPMTFKQPGKTDYYPVWVTYYEKLGRPVPEGEPGCNPGGLSRSPKIRIIGGF